ncbi:MAG: YdcF family protein [Rhodocyclaceae bacterium]|nr:YdcF family protein [Rhodocyclaceae bacterium]
MFYVKKLLSALVLPPAGPLLLAMWGLWLARRHPRLGRGIACVALLGLLALSLPPVADALMNSLEQRPPIMAQQLARAQAIVILGGDGYDAAPEYGGDTVGRRTLERLRYGVYLQKRSGLPILVTGGAPFGGRPGGDSMKEALERDFGGKVKWVEDASRDTAENAAYSARLLKADGISRIALVSHGWHLPRAIELFERQGLEVFPAPTGYTTPSPALFEHLLPSATALEDSSLALHEWLGLFVQRLAK